MGRVWGEFCKLPEEESLARYLLWGESTVWAYIIYISTAGNPPQTPEDLALFFRGVSLACRRPSRAPGVCGLRPELYLCIEGGRGRLLLQSALKGGGGGDSTASAKMRLPYGAETYGLTPYPFRRRDYLLTLG